jgi:hypothetical protein
VINLKTAKALGIEVPNDCSDEAAGVHHAARRRGGRLAARGARAARSSLVGFLLAGAPTMRLWGLKRWSALTLDDGRSIELPAALIFASA